MKYDYRPQGICARQMILDVEDGKMTDLEIIGGCDGNHKGIVSLVKGMKLEDIIEKLEGITCGPRRTSCPDQLAKACRAILEEQNK